MPPIQKSKYLQDLEAKLAKLTADTQELFTKDEHGMYTMDAHVLEEINRRNEEMSRLHDEVKQQEEVEGVEAKVRGMYKRTQEPATTMQHPGAPGGTYEGPNRKSVGQLFVESKAFSGFSGNIGPEVHLDVETKTLFETTAGWTPEATRGPRVELTPERSLVVADLPSLTETNQVAIKFMEETTATKAATEKAEGTEYPEAAFVLTERESIVRKIAVWIPVTDEQFEDEPRARDYINNRLTRSINERLDGQLMNGGGVAPDLRGYLNTPNIQTEAKGANPTPDAVHIAIDKVRFTGFAEPDAAVFHPMDWGEIRRLRTADGMYIWGNPSEAGPLRIWGLPVVVTPAIAQGTALVGAFRAYSELALKRGIDIQVTNAHDTFFINGKLAIRADMRAAMVVYRPLAFCSVTGV
jgi:HK97 family phage major capsid protein